MNEAKYVYLYKKHLGLKNLTKIQKYKLQKSSCPKEIILAEAVQSVFCGHKFHFLGHAVTAALQLQHQAIFLDMKI